MQRDGKYIHVIVKRNPKREGTLAYDRFSVLAKMNNKMIREFKAQEGKHPKIDKRQYAWPAFEIGVALKRGFIKLSNRPVMQ